MRSKKALLLIVAPVLICIFFYIILVKIPLSHKEGNLFITLPYFGPKELASNGDTIYHRVQPFSFINQDGEKISSTTLAGKIYVAGFFFATCQTICPKMAVNLQRVQEKFKMNSKVQIVSFTVDPDHDSVPVLKDYEKMVFANPDKWTFVTGNKKELYDAARNSFLLPVGPGTGDADDFIHSEKLVLVDKEGYIRGYYDGTVIKEVNRLMDEIVVLQAQYKQVDNRQSKKVNKIKSKQSTNKKTGNT